LIDPIDD
jgi:hypothetical protein